MSMRTNKLKALPVGLVVCLIAVLIGGLMATRQGRLRIAAEQGLREEIRDNRDGIQEMRAAIPAEVQHISDAVALIERREAGRPVDGSQVNIGLAVMSLTNANWQAASLTGATSSMDYGKVERFAGAYFEQARLAQLQMSTMESMMSLTSYVGHGEKLASMSPEEARIAEIQAQALLAHLKMMLRMTDGLQEAYSKALI